MGDEPAAILGAIVINQFKQAAEAAHEPKPYHLFIDEFQNFGTSIISTILSEARKWELSLTLPHQTISQIDEEITDSILGNVSTIVAFRIGPNDAPIIGKALPWNPSNLQGLERGVARVRTLVDGKPTGALLLETTKTELKIIFGGGQGRRWFPRLADDLAGTIDHRVLQL